MQLAVAHHRIKVAQAENYFTMSELLFQEYKSNGFSQTVSENDTTDLDSTTSGDFKQMNFDDLEPNSENLDHACAYCHIDHVECVVKCNTCNKWFCNSKPPGSSTSHIVTHLTLSRHNSVSLHEDSDLGDTTLECYNCGKVNVFSLGYVSANLDQVVVILCRLPCSQIKDSNWDSTNWKPLIEERQFVSWIASEPTEDQFINTVQVTPQQIRKLEKQWRLNGSLTLDMAAEVEEEKDEVLPILMRYTDAYQYQTAFAPLVELEAEFDKSTKEAQASEPITVKWGLGLNNKHLVSFLLPNFESSNMKITAGDEIILRFQGLSYVGWECKGIIVKVPSAHQEEFTAELSPGKPEYPVNMAVGFTVEFVWKGTAYERMQSALRTFAVNEKSVSSYIYHKILGHDVKPIEFDIAIPEKLSVPGLGELNQSQLNAVESVLKRPLSLIQGPPGTGKTVTSATIIKHLHTLNKGLKILVCAPSNVAVDHLTLKLMQIGLNVVRLAAKSKEDIESSVEKVCLHNKVAKRAKGPLGKLMRLKDEVGELNASDSKQYFKLLRKSEEEILGKADIICCTCSAAGDGRLSRFKFRSVLIDESTQATEPEMLIPIVKGSRQVILVGDHQQLGPVISEKRAEEAGLGQSLFERLIYLGHVPIRLEVQYRMNPNLSEFSSNMFYEGSLQDGVTVEDRILPNSTFPWPIKNVPMMFWANYGKEEISTSGTSYLNRVEAMSVEKIITRLFKDGVRPEQIGVVTPYEGQRAFILQCLSLNGTTMDKKEDYISVEVESVDAFQGREKDFIILSCVRANDPQNIGFLRDPRRMNVALTRAKYGLIILGDPRTLSRNVLWNHLLIHYREKSALVEGPLENLQLCMVQLESQNQTQTSYKGRGDPGVSKTNTINSVNDNTYSGNTSVNSNFFSRLNELNEDFERQKPKQQTYDEDDIKSITSSFAAGFNL